LRFRKRDHQQSRVSYTLQFPLALLILLPFPLLGARTRLLSSRLPALMIVFPTPHFSTRLPSLSSLRRSLFRTHSGPPQQTSSTPVARSSPSTLGAHPLSFSSLPSPQFSPSSPHPSPVLASLPIPSTPLPSLPTLLASLHSLLLHLRQVAQCSVSCSFLDDIACHCVSLCRSLIFLPPPSFLFPSPTGEST